MKTRINYAKASPEAFKAVMALENYVQSSGLERRFVHLIKLRASIINGCAFCVDMHVKESRHDGLSEQWINLMSVWRESPVYTQQERALLGWVDAVTKIAETGAPDDAFETLKAHFSDEDIVKITVAIGAINTWNRIAVGFRSQHPVDAAAKAA
ncbi:MULTISPECIES: carboxymuconolactone decarboxylase family protein [Rhizobium/Agrobacterium group]|jgi:AhpD family alkylhydroperoxidase|uniref:carboxymuconolactone decarboxylase family protein n=1 Tax=Rhizobium/Agrobacterium group TaxID=227290 RepID=UPI000990023A|nr:MULTISPECIES: carboxymuconolactone decarboxylase family protein [Rhizobium/Agrobacterium group]MCZ7497068.1 carboxymuconolactone decarboxylase family protein [Rhizobium rhizogenes]MBB4400725.1 AhpD family alkylhydroperoxidase [Agrobacterium radiobacter]MBB5586880.1 AhpD family alkylhydroperoxidase [Agrobacterium radiobacter]NSX84406.1 carboxymuconolactone decarboxylase family protein [Agrobacterium tumefaciens]OOO37207.1 alkylhydroperoxidase [Agrobacterium sp. YIC 4121]